MFETYRVKPGDCLWDISKARFGYGHLWPSIYSFNNWAAARRIQHAVSIVDPNIIRPRETILIPDLDMHLLRPLARDPRLTSVIDAADRAARGRTDRIDPRLISPQSIGRDQRNNPAAYLHFRPFWAFEYDLDDLATVAFRAGPLRATIKWGGKVLMQPVHDAALVTLSDHGAVLSQEFKADTVLGEMSTGIDLTYQPGTKTLTFSCNLTRAGHGVVPSIAFEGDAEGPKFLLKWQPFSGHFHGYAFIAACQAEVTITAGGGGGTAGEDGTSSKLPRVLHGGHKPAVVARSSMQPRLLSGHGPRIAMRDHGKPPGSPHRSSGLLPFVGFFGSLVGITVQFVRQNPELFAF